ncbi:hypothetical protein CONPUDRAFT_158763 [Coniophora puteana RWD-64-598 SS2]|uniref:Homeobox domain-containing protein n=1 Tax=Coniophora puteana (strain RWD-64-598) TaxID=741705 RepID=A0A5M3MA29_CONPW|nr:uncharacterized protein CONPUDRAFT_158763 [Coniophora puteana RWD-64-598 SS2]EIW75983.1 hypothetical protein CONPUDRAFT_158763 [Coniophora puteana RWD-64-598 SS2]
MVTISHGRNSSETPKTDPVPPAPKQPKLTKSQLDELWLIWENSPCVPTPTSMDSWAISRKADPLKVRRFFSRRKCQLRKKNRRIPGETYDLRISTPPFDPQLALTFRPASSPGIDDAAFPSSDATMDFDESSSTLFDPSDRSSAEPGPCYSHSGRFPSEQAANYSAPSNQQGLRSHINVFDFEFDASSGSEEPRVFGR